MIFRLILSRILCPFAFDFYWYKKHVIKTHHGASYDAMRFLQ